MSLQQRTLSGFCSKYSKSPLYSNTTQGRFVFPKYLCFKALKWIKKFKCWKRKVFWTFQKTLSLFAPLPSPYWQFVYLSLSANFKEFRPILSPPIQIVDVLYEQPVPNIHKQWTNLRLTFWTVRAFFDNVPPCCGGAVPAATAAVLTSAVQQ